MTVPATDIRGRRLIDQKRWMTILTIVMMPTKWTTSHPSLIKADISANHAKRVLCGTPVPNSPRSLNHCGRLTFFEGYVVLGLWATVIALKQGSRQARDHRTIDG